jgi:hypothetical protein
MTRESSLSTGGRTVETLDRAYREANLLVVWAGLVLAGEGILPSSPEMKALSAALGALNRARSPLGTRAFCDSSKEVPHAVPTPESGRRFRRAAP